MATAATTSSGNIAKERLSLIIASQRGSSMLENVDMNLLQKDVMMIVQVRRSLIVELLVSMAMEQEGQLIEPPRRNNFSKNAFESGMVPRREDIFCTVCRKLLSWRVVQP